MRKKFLISFLLIFLCLLVCVFKFCNFAKPNNDSKMYNVYMPEVIYFDYDMTIENNQKYLVDAFQYSINKNLDKHTVKIIDNIKGDNEKWQYIINNMPEQVYKRISYNYDDYVVKQKFFPVKDFDIFLSILNRKDKLSEFARPKKIILSQKGVNGLKRLARRAMIDQYFDGIYGSFSFGYLEKPMKEFGNAIKKDSKTEGKKCWMIGDRIQDVMIGLNMDCVVFIIDTVHYNKIKKQYNDLINKKIFFTTYIKLSRMYLDRIVVR